MINEVVVLQYRTWHVEVVGEKSGKKISTLFFNCIANLFIILDVYLDIRIW